MDFIAIKLHLINDNRRFSLIGVEDRLRFTLLAVLDPPINLVLARQLAQVTADYFGIAVVEDFDPAAV